MNTIQQPEARIEAIISKACGQYRTGDSYTFEDVWNCIEAALASVKVPGAVPVGFRTRVPGFDWTPWITDDQTAIEKAIKDAHDHGFDGEALFGASVAAAVAELDDPRVNLEHTMWRIATHRELEVCVTDEVDEVRAAIAGRERKAFEYGLRRGYAIAAALPGFASGKSGAALTSKVCTAPDQPAAVRKRICEAIDGAMAFGYLNLNEPPASHWLAPWWAAGRAQRAAMNALRYLDRELTQYLDGMPADETSRKLRDTARDGLAGIDSAPLASAAVAVHSRELDALTAVATHRPLTADEVSRVRELVRAREFSATALQTSSQCPSQTKAV